MRKSLYSIFVGGLVLLFVSCNVNIKPEATGRKDVVTVVMDSSMWHSQTADAIRQVFGHYVTTLPNPYPLFDIKFTDFDTDAQLNEIQKYKNIVFAAPIGGNGDEAAYIRALMGDSVLTAIKQGRLFKFTLQDHWYDNQLVYILTSTSDSLLAKKIRNSAESLLTPLLELTFKRYRQLVYNASERKEIENKIWNEHGWKIRIPNGWHLHIDTTYTQANGAHTGFLTLRNNSAGNQRWFWAWWTDSPPPESVLDPHWINQTRDSLLKKYIRGPGSSYVTTDYKHMPVLTDTLRFNGYLAYETRGGWKMTNGTVAMGGPFVNMMVKDKLNGRLFLLGFGQFAPSFNYLNKRRYIRRFRAVLRTFRTDSTWSQRSSKQQN